MSRSNPTPTNPSQHFFSWSGSKGRLEWYDKEKQERIPVKIPFEFMVLDELATITGFNEQDSSSYWSNEVRSVAKEELNVKTSRGTKQVGLYKDLADIRGKGAKYAKSIYIAHKDGSGNYVIGNIKASGAALTAWIELGNKYVVGNGTVSLVGSTEGKKGATVYKIPTFEYRSSTEEENKLAIDLDKELQLYLSQYLASAQFDRINQDKVEDDANLWPEHENPEDTDKATTKTVKADEIDIEDLDDEEINLSDIPF